MLIRPAKRLQGETLLPGDKSISHRAAMLSAMASGVTTIENFAASADCASTLTCLAGLGVKIEQQESSIVVEGVGKSGFTQPQGLLDCGNSGTTMRLMAGVLAGQGFDSVLTGDESLSSRPMRRVIDPLAEMGAMIGSDDGRAPLRIHGRRPLKRVEYCLPVASAQIKSCVLLAALSADGESAVIESVPSRDHTERMLRTFGVEVREVADERGKRLSIDGGGDLRSPGVIDVPADISASAFFIVAAGCLPSSVVRMPNVGVNPGRYAIVDVARRLGVDVHSTDRKDTGGEPRATITVKGRLRRQNINEIKGGLVASLIDELPIVAVLGTQLEFGLEVRDAAELRVKETDRISAVVENLRRMGASVEEFEDGFRIERSSLHGTTVDSFGDHRIAMAFAVAGLLAEGETQIDGSDCVAVSFPGFFEALQNVAIY